jgi:hypothetical protein
VALTTAAESVPKHDPLAADLTLAGAGIQILADHPRLYWNRDRTRGTEWLRFSPSGTGVPLREELLKAGKLETEAIDKIAEACFYLSSDLNAPHRDPSRVARGGAGSERPRHTPDRGIGK